ncbi:hypothetical protein ACWEFL_02700 [Streptomyces sp. NPDC004838]
MNAPHYEPEPEPDRTPRPSTVTDQPATVARCAEDYANGADVRANLDRQLRRR